jgi:acetyl-CoA carboxylase carboxyltransferase component
MASGVHGTPYHRTDRTDAPLSAPADDAAGHAIEWNRAARRPPPAVYARSSGVAQCGSGMRTRDGMDTAKGEAMNWQPELDELRAREAFAQQMGGADKVKRQHDGGRLTVRERIDGVVDAGSFHEVGAVAGKASYDPAGNLTNLVPANCVFGRALIDGRPVVVCGDDFTVRGGSADATIKEKTLMAEQMANQFRLPIVRIIEGSGGGGSVKTIETTGRANLPGRVGGASGYHLATINMGAVPVVALGLGSVAGLGAARLAASHYSVMTKTTSAMFVAGPPVVERIGQKLTKQELGGWEVQTKAGAVDHAVDTEADAFACARRFLSYLPSSVHGLPPVLPATDDPLRRDESLLGAVPRDRRRVYRMRPIIETLVDKGSFFEMGRMFGRSIITGFARIEGRAVAVMAGDPYFYGGAWTADACAKIIRFVDTSQTFHLPVVHLVDCPGFLIGLEAEQTTTIRAGVRAMAAIDQTTVPWCSVIVRNVFGVAGALHQPPGRLSLRYAWPSAYWGSLPLEGGIEAAYRADLDASSDPTAKLAEIEDRLNKLRSPFRSAETFWVEEIIDPRDTRKLLCEFARLSDSLLTPGPSAFTMRP